MNWTGGRLQRHSKNNAKSTDLARQKQHFAAVRQRLQNGETSQAPSFRPSFLVRDGLTLGNGVTPFGQGSQRHTGHSRGKQRSLEDYSSTAPLAQRLSSMQRRPAASRDQHTRQQKLPSSHRRHSGDTDLPQVKYEASSEGPPRNRRDAASTSSQHSSSRKRGRSRLGEEDLLHLSRKKLLLQNDWIGLAHSRPVQISFTSRQDKERIGKRRKIDSGIEERQRMFGKMKQVNHDYGDAAQPPFMSGALGVAPESISVRIGDHALSQVSVAPQDSDRLREVVEQVRQSSESMLFDVEQRELSQPLEFSLNEERVGQEPSSRIDTEHTHEQDASGSHALPVYISDDTDTSEDSASALDECTRELEPRNESADAAIEEGLGVQQLLDHLNGQDNDDHQHNDDQGYSPILSVHNPQLTPAPFRLVFGSSSDDSDMLALSRPLEVPPGYDTQQPVADRPVRNNPPFDVGDADPIMPNFVDVHAARARRSHVQQTDEVEPSEGSLQDDDAPWKKLFSIPSSHSAFTINEFEPEVDGNGNGSFHSINASLATTRDGEFKTLRPAQSLLEAESSASVVNSSSASFRMISKLAAQPPREKDISEANIANSYHKIAETKHSDPDEYWRKFVFEDDAEDEDEEEQEQDDRTTAAQRTFSVWPSSSPTQDSRSAKFNLASKSSMEINTSPSDASLAFRARADSRIPEQRFLKTHGNTSAALSMKNNVSNPSDSAAETDAPVKNKARGRRGKSNEVGKKEMAHHYPSPDLRQQVAAAAQGQAVKPAETWKRLDRFDAGEDVSKVGRGGRSGNGRTRTGRREGGQGSWRTR